MKPEFKLDGNGIIDNGELFPRFLRVSSTSLSKTLC